MSLYILIDEHIAFVHPHLISKLPDVSSKFFIEGSALKVVGSYESNVKHFQLHMNVWQVCNICVLYSDFAPIDMPLLLLILHPHFV
jgi:hypothetical protein